MTNTKVDRLRYVGVAVPNFDEAVDYYGGIWGLTRIDGEPDVAYFAAEGSAEQYVYRIRKADRPAFLQAMQLVATERRRDGAYAWGVAEHTGEPERVIEWFLVESWAEHLRQHDRVSQADADLQAQALRFHQGPGKPVVHHFLALAPG